jgi:FkbM family methyltransferase
MISELKYEFIRTRLEEPLMGLRRALDLPRRLRHPELREIYREDARIHAAVRRILRPDSNCVDVGCHYGSMLSRFCRNSPRGRHVAFEAIPGKVRFLRRKFPEVDVRQLALSDHAGSAQFYVDRKATGFSGLARRAGRDVEALEVGVDRLDDVLPRDRRYHLLKLDVEGAELLVLRGGLATLRRHRPAILFECAPGGPSAFGYAPGDLHDLLTGEAGYAVFFLRDYLEGGAPAGRAAFEEACTRYPFTAFNWIALPDPRPPAGSPHGGRAREASR